MRFSAISVLSASTAILTYAAPFQIQDGELQRHRRRAVDYPVDYVDAPKPERKLRKRAALPYSIVNVDGQGSTNAPPPAPSATMTVTRSGSVPSPSTQTIVVTSVIPGPTSDETIFITTTQVAAAPAQVITTEVQNPVPAPPATVTATAPADFTAALGVAGPSDPVTNTVMNTMVQTVTSTAVASSPTSYYDDGLWHTYYPIKTFVPPPLSSSASVAEIQAQAAQPTVGAVPSTPSTQYGLQNASDASPADEPAGSAGIGSHARRWDAATPAAYDGQWQKQASATPVAYQSQWSSEEQKGEPDCTSTPVPYAGASWAEQTHHDGAAYAPQEGAAFNNAEGRKADSVMQPRRAPVEIKTANWITSART